MSHQSRMLTKAKKIAVRILSICIKVAGVVGLILFLLSLTDLPFNAYHWLGTSNSKLKKNPDVIVLLGGAGMPSPDGLMRCYYASEAAHKYKNIDIIIALPSDENDSTKQLDLMAHELIMRGIDSSRIRYEPLGFNTHSQAENIAAMFGSLSAQKTALLITSPEHMYRSVLSFVKAGFQSVGGMPTFEKPIPPIKIKDRNKSKDKRIKNLGLRYNIWSYLNYELLVIKEFCAITYYKLKGWA